MTKEIIKAAEQCLIDNGVEKDEASIVLQALGYILLDKDIYEEYRKNEYVLISVCERDITTAFFKSFEAAFEKMLEEIRNAGYDDEDDDNPPLAKGLYTDNLGISSDGTTAWYTGRNNNDWNIETIPHIGCKS